MEGEYSARQSVREAHEHHVTGHSGCQWYEVLLVLYPVYPSVVILGTLFRNGNRHSSSRLAVEMLLCVVPVVAAQTVAHNFLVPLALCLTLLAALTARAATTQMGGARPGPQATPIPDKKSDSLTLLRAILGLSTATAILAVDFHAFPRRFAKTEEFGWSLMDVGAAAFLLLSAVVDQRLSAPRSVSSVAREVGVLLVLGTARLVSLSAADYQQHSSEYGSHSNFFFVLAFTKVVCVRWCKSASVASVAIIGCCVTVLQHIYSTSLQHWVLSDVPRETFLSSNRESVAAAPGYVALYCWGAALGKLLLATKSDGSSSASEFLHGPRQVALGSAAAAAGAGGVLWFVVSVLQVQPSRRLVNTPFIIWMVFILLLFTSLANSVEAFLKSITPLSDVVPRVFRAINGHQLLFFLASNLLTGFINLSINTLSVHTPWDVVIISMYAALLCSVAVYISGAPEDFQIHQKH